MLWYLLKIKKILFPLAVASLHSLIWLSGNRLAITVKFELIERSIFLFFAGSTNSQDLKRYGKHAFEPSWIAENCDNYILKQWRILYSGMLVFSSLESNSFLPLCIFKKWCEDNVLVIVIQSWTELKAFLLHLIYFWSCRHP